MNLPRPPRAFSSNEVGLARGGWRARESVCAIAFRCSHFRDAVRAKGGIPLNFATAIRGSDKHETVRKLHDRKQQVHCVHARLERIFGTLKRCYGLRRTQWRSSVKAAVQVHLTAIVDNLNRTMNILAA